MSVTRFQTVGVAILVVAVGLLLGWAVRKAGTPLPTFTLPNGGPTVQVVAITTGTNHVHGPWLTRLAAKPLFSFLARFGPARTSIAQRTTSEPSVVVWFQPSASPALPPPGLPGRSWKIALANEAGFVAGNEATVTFWAQESASFEAVPRRSRELDLRLFEMSANSTWIAVTNIRVPNPWFGKSPVWTPEPLPATRTNGPLIATLEAFSIGHDHQSTSRSLANGQQSVEWGVVTNGEPGGAVVRGRFVSPGVPGASWMVAASEFLDATGNRVRSASQSWTGVDEFRSYRVEPTLWPDEGAWRLRLTLKRDRGHATNELFRLSGLPLPAVGATNQFSSLVTNWAGVNVTFRHLVRRASGDLSSWSSRDLSEIALRHSPLPSGVFLDLVSIRPDGAETNLEVPSWSSSSSGDRTYSIKRIPDGTRTLELCFCVQRGRTVEFMVAPTVAKAAGEERPAP